MTLPDSFCFHPRVIALTGGIGSGKSSVSVWLRDNAGFAYVSADALVASLLEVGSEGWRQLRTVLTPDFFFAAGQIDKAGLRVAIFRDAVLRSAVEQVLHPLVFKKIRGEVAGLEAQGKMRCLVEVPLLYEAGWQRYFHKVIVVYAEDTVCAARLQGRDGLRLEDALAAVDMQISLKEKILLADYAVDNSGQWSATIVLIKKLQKELDTWISMS